MSEAESESVPEKPSMVPMDHVLSVSSLGDEDALQDFGTDTPFPLDPDAPEEQQFTFRAVFVGCALGAVISASKCVSSSCFVVTD